MEQGQLPSPSPLKAECALRHGPFTGIALFCSFIYLFFNIFPWLKLLRWYPREQSQRLCTELVQIAELKSEIKL